MRIISAFNSRSFIRAAALAAAVTLGSADMLQDAVANGDTRTITLHHVHSGESATVTFKRNGRYDPAALKQLNVLLQDWRRKEPTNMDPQLFDIVWEVYRETDATQPIQVIGGYRSPETNSMLRARSRGVAQTSLHMQGKAMDFFIPGVPLSKIREAGLRLQRGGVGFYPTSGSPFVHLDTGGVRHWPRMSRPELARVFPDGKTVHIPADGKPMAGYALALNEVESRGSEPGGAGAAFAGLGGGNNPKRATGSAASNKNIFASLFGKDEDDDESAAPAKVAPAKPAVAPVAVASTTETDTEAAPAPTPVAVAAAEPVAVPLPTPNPIGRVAMAQAAPASVALPAITPPPAADRQALAALAAAVPLPKSRPSLAEPNAGTAPVVADASAAIAGVTAPRPPARPAEAGALPELVVPGAKDEGGGPMLAYASAATGIFPTERLQPGRAPNPTAVALAAAPRATAHASGAALASAPRGPAYSAEMQAEIRRLFSGPTVAKNVALRTPELRRFAAFVAPPRTVVAGGFSKDGSNGLSTTQFQGAAVVAVPVVAMISGAAPIKKPL
ncbi:DUF882 domain-containing protein [Ancylobacter sp. VNQ12]|uniref:DUF882 domain-containing protein n=1 Tax=Ancylobacter sp. VNQ12 TaxID=3400920 RepID=UPI003C06D3D5